LNFSAARRVLETAIADRAFPATSIEVGSAREILWRDALGRLTFDAEARAAGTDTIFDLASLTKVLSTTPLVMQQVERGTLSLDDPVSRHMSAWRGDDRAGVTLRDLLSHCSGLPWWRPFYRTLKGRAEFERAICAEPLDYEPRARSVYSDLDFMLLGFMLEDGGSLNDRFATLLGEVATSVT